MWKQVKSSTCIRIGYGKVAQMHDSILRGLGISTIGIIEADEEKEKLARNRGIRVFSCYEEAAEQNPQIWDVCVDTGAHIDVLRQIITIVPHANILMEKPLCYASELGKVDRLLSNFTGKITIGENYASSNLLSLIIQKLYPTHIPESISIEFVKDRRQDMSNGRFTDKEFGVLGYEGSHMLEVVCQVARCWTIKEIHAKQQDTHTHASEFSLENGIRVQFATSTCSAASKESARKVTIGAKEPIIGTFDCQTHDYISKLLYAGSEYYFTDNSMRNHLSRALQYFEGKAENPYTWKSASNIVKLLQSLSQ